MRIAGGVIDEMVNYACVDHWLMVARGDVGQR